MGKKVFITGATGQVGSHLAEYIVKEKLLGISGSEDVICLIRKPEKAFHLKSLGVTIIEGELEDSDTIFEVMKNGIDYVFHVAANCSITATYDEMYGPNVLGTRILLEAFANSKARCFVYTSTIGVYASFLGKERIYIVDENYPIGSLEGDPYAVTKRLAEGIVHYYSEQYPEKAFIIVRLGPIMGPRDRQALPSFVKGMSYQFLPKLIDRGKDIFSVTSPHDAARAQVFLAKIASQISGEAFNVAANHATFRQVFTYITEYYGRRPPKLSLSLWFFKLILPLLGFIRKLFPNNQFIQTIFSPLCLKYIGKSYIYNSEKIKNLGFNFVVSAEETIKDGLQELDPNRKMIKPGRRLKASLKGDDASVIDYDQVKDSKVTMEDGSVDEVQPSIK